MTPQKNRFVFLEERKISASKPLRFLCFQRLKRGITPDIKSNRIKAPAKRVLKPNESGPDIGLVGTESSARLLKNSSFMTQNNSFANTTQYGVQNP